VGQPPAYKLLHENNPRAFGHSRVLRCPYYLEEGGRCGLWRHRASVCATYFCKHVRGTVGRNFWMALHQLLSAVERDLCRWCVLDLDVGAEALERLFPTPRFPEPAKGVDGNDLDGTVNSESYRALWGNWSGREADFYKECARRVDALTWQQ